MPSVYCLFTQVPRDVTSASPSARWLSACVVLCAAAASIVTLVWAGAFPPVPGAIATDDVLAEARGWSSATLLLALPTLVGGMAFGHRVRGRLLWAGSLAYCVYTYLTFAVSPPFTALSFLYIAAFGCAVPALLLVVASLASVALTGRLPRRLVAAFAFLFAVALPLAWLPDMAKRLLHNDAWPVGAAAVGQVVHALDLGLLVPLAVSAGILVTRRHLLGDVVAALFLVVAAEMGGALAAMVAWSSVAGGHSLLAAAPFAVAWAVAVLLLGLFMRAAQKPLSGGETSTPSSPA